MIGKLIEDNVILKNKVETIFKRGQCGEEHAILRSEVESIRGHCDQIENKVEDIRHGMTRMRDEVEAINFRLEGVQEGNYTLSILVIVLYVYFITNLHGISQSLSCVN